MGCCGFLGGLAPLVVISTFSPTFMPSSHPTLRPSPLPSPQPTLHPSPLPTSRPNPVHHHHSSTQSSMDFRMWFLVPFWTALAAGVVMALRNYLHRIKEEEQRARNEKAAGLCQQNLRLIAESKAGDATRQRWDELAWGIETLEKVQEFFKRRMRAGQGRKLTLRHASKVINISALHGFRSSTRNVGDANMNPHVAAHASNKDTFLFHGAPEASMANIQVEGLSMRFANVGMLGRGIYGAPDPRKSAQYCGQQLPVNGKFLLICRFNLSGAQYARNSLYDEYCVDDASKVTVLWLLKVE